MFSSYSFRIASYHYFAGKTTSPPVTDEKGEIVITIRWSDDSVLIMVKDNGVGIPYEIKDMIYDSFFTTKEVGKGSGQGLAVAYHIITEKYKGKTWFDSSSGEELLFIYLC